VAGRGSYTLGMAVVPAAEVSITPALVTALLRSQSPHLLSSSQEPRRAAAGWDSEMWRVGGDLAVRLPRRAAAAALIAHEQRALPGIAARVASVTDVGIPAPVHAGRADAGFPWPWSVVPWFDGDAADIRPRSERTAWAPALAAALGALHAPAPQDHPRNPVRGVPLADRDGAVRARIAAVGGEAAAVAARHWDRALRAPARDAPALWIHGDLHPGNLVADGARLAAIVDFGDVTAGDPAYDLAIAWLAFDAPGRDVFVRATGDRYDAATWTRAAGWAASMALLLLSHGDEHPSFARVGREALAELAAGERAS
jgi:aminoglycoside phosphotransferase (APT) family kinase protein